MSPHGIQSPVLWTVALDRFQEVARHIPSRATSTHVYFGSHWPGGMGWRLKSGCSVAGLGLAGWDSVPGTSKA